MTLRRATIWISLSAGALALAGCQDLPQGYPHGRDQPSWHAQEFAGQNFEGGLESPNAIRNPRPNEGAIAPKPAPGTGGAGLEKEKNLLDVAPPTPTLAPSPLSSTKSPSALRAPQPRGTFVDARELLPGRRRVPP